MQRKVRGRPPLQHPHLTETEIQQRFLQAFNRLLIDRWFIIADTSVIMERLTETDKLKSEADDLQEEMAVASELIRQAVEQNASMVKRVTVEADGKMRFTFANDMEIIG